MGRTWADFAGLSNSGTFSLWPMNPQSYKFTRLPLDSGTPVKSRMTLLYLLEIVGLHHGTKKQENMEFAKNGLPVCLFHQSTHMICLKK